MTQVARYIILRTTDEAAANGYGASGWSTRGSPQVSATLLVEVADLNRREVLSMRREPGVDEIAPAIPVGLVLPLGGNEGSSVPSNATWGNDEVGASQSVFTGKGVKVAVLDTGIDAEHEAFAGVQLNERDFTGDGNGDENGHGTHCAGTILGRDACGIRIGVAPGIESALIGKVLDRNGSGSSDSISRAILWAVTEGADVINLSIGIDFPGYVARLAASGMPIDLATSKALEGYRANIRLFDRLASLIRAHRDFGCGALIVAAAGNESKRGDAPSYEIAVSPPASADGVVSVGAIGRGGASGLRQVAPFSNSGPDVVAPGVDVFSARAGGGYRYLSGTSMAAPHAAGVAALWGELLLGECGRIDSVQLAARVTGQARFLPELDPLDIGTGLVQAP